ncbi:hypothetical protein O6H91_03G040900 [Diphasiastrum complanatum]|uniref:Uncharacterized protein n=1 Tax=Diphasiastrum complanatum TaxID=34168 RepID=A0ACC2E5F5_DIPCM|nr:hypothetical protein O6H91_03G040900 [Diphasiastrum complanatum]
MQFSIELGSRPTSAQVMPPTTQMTIFYAGIFNVYDDIPDDKGQAIMLLAGCGNLRAMSALHPPANEHPISALSPILAVSPSVPASALGDHCRDATSKMCFFRRKREKPVSTKGETRESKSKSKSKRKQDKC